MPVAVIATFSVCPCVPNAGVTLVMVCAFEGSAMMNAEFNCAVSVPPAVSGVVTVMLRAPYTKPPPLPRTNVALIWFGETTVTPVTVMSDAILLLSVSVKPITDDVLKFVHPLPVITTGTDVPADPAPGDTTATAAGGFVVLAEPSSDTTSGDPTAAVCAIVNDPLSGPGVAVGLGSNTTFRLQVDFAAISPVPQLLVGAKLPTGVIVNVSGCDS